MTKSISKKKHADFQSRYRRSFNFNNETKQDPLVLDEQGRLVLRKPNEDK